VCQWHRPGRQRRDQVTVNYSVGTPLTTTRTCGKRPIRLTARQRAVRGHASGQRGGSVGTNAFIRDGDRIFRTYLVASRSAEALGTTWSYLDITALGRQEEWEDSPEGYPQTPPYQWWNYHDAYR